LAFLDLEFSGLSFGQVLDAVAERAAEPRFSYIVTPNVDHVVKLRAAEEMPSLQAFRGAYDAAALRLCDSRILAALAKPFGIALPVVPGSDLTAAIFHSLLVAGNRVAIVGGTDDTIPRLKRLYPRIEFVQHVPPMGMLSKPDAMRAAEEFVSQCRASYVLFATGAPQSEILAHHCLERGDAQGVGLCIGASIDFLLGDQRRAPRWMQRVGLEWAHRLATNPRRLWRRYLVEGPRIFLIAARWWWKRRNRVA
jgi:exopolysaccharide biosynthesis WecB/TagA/CpsF family protein